MELSNLDKCIALIEWMLEDEFVASLVYIGKFGDPDLKQELAVANKG